MAVRAVLAVALATVVTLGGIPAGALPAGPVSAGAVPAGAVLGAVHAAAAAPACPEAASRDVPVDRVAGADRYATAACASQAAFPSASGGTVLLARGDDAGGWADALAGTVLATALDAPLLLTAPDALPAAVAQELDRLRPREVVVLGGETAVSPDVTDEVAEILPDADLERVAGSDRHATAAEVSARAGGGSTAFVVNGFRPSDALVAGAPAARGGARLLLTTSGTVPAATRAALEGVSEVVVIGGYGVVSQEVEDELAGLVGAGHVRRVSGGDRFETAAAVARAFPVPDGRIHLAAGGDGHLVDAISAGWSAAGPDGGIVLFGERDRLGRGTDRYLRLGGLTPTTPTRLFGGTSALSPTLVSTLEQRYAEAEAGGRPPAVLAMWVHLFDPALKSRAGIDRVLDAAAAANLNTVIVQVARRQDAYYRSTVLPRTPDPTMPADLDVLARLIPAARDRGLAVHAWVSSLPAYHGAYDGLRLPVWEQHGPGSADPWVSVDHAGRQGSFLDPGVPAVRDHVTAVFAELAGSYDLDAVHIDYLRYESKQWGYHPASLERFREAHDLPSDARPAPTDPAWGEWRRRMTTEVATAVRDAVRAANPDVAVTIAASTIGEPPRSTTDMSNTRTWSDVFQPWPQWLSEGIIDAAFPMNYFREATHAAWFDGWVAYEQALDERCEAQRPSCVLAVGQGAYLNPLSSSLSQVRQALSAVDGVVVYSYQQNADRPPTDALLAAFPTAVVPDPAPAPRLR